MYLAPPSGPSVQQLPFRFVRVPFYVRECSEMRKRYSVNHLCVDPVSDRPTILIILALLLHTVVDPLHSPQPQQP